MSDTKLLRVEISYEGSWTGEYRRKLMSAIVEEAARLAPPNNVTIRRIQLIDPRKK